MTQFWSAQVQGLYYDLQYGKTTGWEGYNYGCDKISRQFLKPIMYASKNRRSDKLQYDGRGLGRY
ncbi:hypothetical protein J6590_060221, partial [Homalodisca vitripennis]